VSVRAGNFVYKRRVDTEKESQNQVDDILAAAIESFSSKDDLLARIIEKYLLQKAYEIEVMLREHPAQEAPVLMRMVVSYMMANFDGKEGIAKFMFLKVHQLNKTALQTEVRSRIAKIIAESLCRRNSALDAGAAQTRASVAMNAMMGVIFASVMNGEFRERRIQLQSELEALVTAYLSI
jgi:hypothetical protein